MLPKVWISPNPNEELHFDEDGAPIGWQIVGTIEMTRETKLWRIVQGHLGLRSPSATRSVTFWLDGDLSSEWVQRAATGEPREFRLAIDLRPAYRFLLMTNQPARLGNPDTREPEAHPAFAEPQFVGIRLQGSTNGLFQHIDV